MGIGGIEYLLHITEKKAVLVHVDDDILDLKVPETVLYEGEEYPVCGIGPDAIGKDSNLVSVSLPDSVTELPDGCFRGCRSLKRIDLGNGLRSVGADAFCDCVSLETVRLPPTVGSIGKRSFFSCTGLKEVVLSPKCRVLDEYSFYRCVNLRRIDLPEQLEEIRECALYGCGLTEVDLSDNIMDVHPLAIGGDTFKEFRVSPGNRHYSSGKYGALYSKDGSELISMPGTITGFIKLPDSVKVIGRQAFYHSRLSGIVLGDGIREIHAFAFYGSDLGSVIIPKTVEYLGDSAFSYCDRLIFAEILSPESVCEELFSYCKSLMLVRICNETTEIGMGAFECCSSLKIIELPFGLKSIESGAFYHSGLTEVSLPSHVKSVGDAAFRGTNIEKAEFDKALKHIGHSAFGGCRLKEADILCDCSVERDAFEDCPLTDVTYHGTSPLDLPEGCTLHQIYVPRVIENDENKKRFIEWLKRRADEFYKVHGQ